MTRLRNTNLDVFIQFQHTRTILRNENMRESLLKKYSKFQKIHEMLYCGMTRIKNVNLGVFRQYQNTKIISKKKNMGQNRFKKLSKFQKFQLSNFTLTWSSHGKMNGIPPDMAYLKNTTTINENIGQTYLKKIFEINSFSEILCHGHI